MKDEMDILKEVGNISAAHGSIALSEILRKTIRLGVPKTQLISSAGVSKVIAFEKTGIAVYSKIVTGLNGRVIFLLDEKNAFKLNEMSYQVQTESKKSGVMTEMGMSLIKEIGSMVTSAYVNAIGMMFKRVILLGAPMLIAGTMNEILNITVFNTRKEESEVLLIEAEFSESEGTVSGSFYLVLTTEAAEEVKIVCKEMLAKLQE